MLSRKWYIIETRSGAYSNVREHRKRNEMPFADQQIGLGGVISPDPDNAGEGTA